MIEELKEIKEAVKDLDEERLESIIAYLLQQLAVIKVKRVENEVYKDPNELIKIRMINEVIEKIRIRNKRIKSFILPKSVQKVYELEKVYAQVHKPFYNEEKQEISKEVIQAVEQWIDSIKSIYSRITHKKRSFIEENNFWRSLKVELEEMYNFSVSEEYKFVIEILKRTNKLSLMYTLMILINNEKIYKLCDLYLKYYDSIIINISKDNINSLLRLLLNLKRLEVPSRIIRKSIANNLNELRKEILRKSINFEIKLISFYAKIYKEYTILCNFYNNRNLKEGSSILIEEIKDLKEYEKRIESIYKAEVLKEFSKEIKELNDFIEQERENLNDLIYSELNYSKNISNRNDNKDDNKNDKDSNDNNIDNTTITNINKADKTNININNINKTDKTNINIISTNSFVVNNKLIDKLLKNKAIEFSNSINNNEIMKRITNFLEFDIFKIELLKSLKIKLLEANQTERIILIHLILKINERIETKKFDIKKLENEYEEYLKKYFIDILEEPIINNDQNNQIVDEIINELSIFESINIFNQIFMNNNNCDDNNDIRNDNNVNKYTITNITNINNINNKYTNNTVNNINNKYTNNTVNNINNKYTNNTVNNINNKYTNNNINNVNVVIRNINWIKKDHLKLKQFIKEYKEWEPILKNIKIEEYFKEITNLKWKYFNEEIKTEGHELFKNLIKNKNEFIHSLEEYLTDHKNINFIEKYNINDKFCKKLTDLIVNFLQTDNIKHNSPCNIKTFLKDLYPFINKEQESFKSFKLELEKEIYSFNFLFNQLELIDLNSSNLLEKLKNYNNFMQLHKDLCKLKYIKNNIKIDKIEEEYLIIKEDVRNNLEKYIEESLDSSIDSINIRNSLRYFKILEVFNSSNLLSNNDNYELDNNIKDSTNVNLKISLTNNLSNYELELLFNLRIKLNSKIDELHKTYKNFPGDESTFYAYLNQFKIKLNLIKDEIKIYNKLFMHYKIEAIEFIEEELNIKRLEEEYKIYEYLCYNTIETIINFNHSNNNDQIRDNDGNSCNDHISDNDSNNINISTNKIIDIIDISTNTIVGNTSFNLSVLNDINSNISTNNINNINNINISNALNYLYQIPINQINLKDSKDPINWKYLPFKLNTKLKDYLTNFNEDKIKESIQKIKIDNEILKYIKDRNNINRDTFNYLVNLNKYNFYESELNSIHLLLLEKEKIANLLDNSKVLLLELKNIIYNNNIFKELFESKLNLIENKLKLIKKEINFKLILEELESIKSSINIKIEEIRKESNRLYFIKNIDLIRSMNGKEGLEMVLKSVFNIRNVLFLEKNGSSYIIGLEGNNKELLLFREEISINESVGIIVNKVERNIKININESLNMINEIKELNMINEIKELNMIKEMKEEYLYYHSLISNNNTNNSNNNISILSKNNAKIRKVNELLLKFPDLLKTCIFSNFKTKNLEYYQPLSSPFIFTFLTAKIFTIIHLSKNLAGVIFYGPSGTGKTESVKYFCRSIGHPLFVFCCNENCDYETLKNILIGCELTGSYVCFDEFNRLKKDVMSSITELFYLKRKLIKVFLTMNLGYKGRSEVPITLKNIFGELLVKEPNIKDIVYYYTNEYKVYELLEELKEECSKNDYYDYGIRALSFVFNTDNINNDCKNDCNNDCNTTKNDNSGNRFINSNNISTNNNSDTTNNNNNNISTNVNDRSNNIDIFIDNLNCFYSAVYNKKDKEILKNKIYKIFNIKILEPSLENIFKKALSIRNALLIFGGRGKTSLINKCANKNSTIFRYNPLNLLQINSSICGTFNKNTKEWSDSVFLKDLRKSLIENINNQVWFIFDGPLKSEWIEDFNSIFDDNKILCLVTGERIKIPFNFKFIFESDSIEDITLATLTRLFTIFISCSDNCFNCFNDSNSNNDISNCNSNNDISHSNDCNIISSSDRVVALINNSYINTDLILYSSSILDYLPTLNSLNSNKQLTILLESFENSKIELQEQVREFWEYGTIDNIKIDNIKLICNNINNNKRLLGIRRISINNLTNNLSNNFINNNLTNNLDSNCINVIENFIVFLKNTHPSFNSSKIKLFLKLIDFEFLKNCSFLESYLFFLCEIVLEKDIKREILEKYLKNIKLLSFNGCTFNLSNNLLDSSNNKILDSISTLESKLSYSLFRNCSVSIIGPSLSGKSYLIKKCINLIDRNLSLKIIREFQMENKVIDNTTFFKPGIVYAFLLLKKTSFTKLLEENTLKFDLCDLSFILEMKNVISSNTFISNNEISSNTFISSNNNLINSSVLVNYDDCFNSTNTYTNNSSISSSVGIEYNYNDCLHNFKNFSIKFNNIYKLSSFLNVFNILNNQFSTQFKNRSTFLKNGLKRIEEFSNHAETLRKTIENETILLEKKKLQLKNNISILLEEKKECQEEQREIQEKQKEINKEVKESEDKKEIIKEKLILIEKLLEESKKDILELNKSHLSEIKGMNNPPEIIRKTIENVYLFLEGNNKNIKVPDWGYLQGYLKRDDFIQKIRSFNNESCNEYVCNSCNDISNGFNGNNNNSNSINIVYDEDYKKVKKASKTCAVLFKWLYSIINKNKILVELLPLKKQVDLIDLRILEMKKETNLKIEQFNNLFNKITEIQKDRENCETEIKVIESNIEKFTSDFILLEKILKNFRKESINWKKIEFKNPIFITKDPHLLLKYFKILRIDRNVLNSNEFKEFRKESIEVSINDCNLKKGMSDAIYLKRNLIITEIEEYNLDISIFLREHIINRGFNDANGFSNKDINKSFNDKSGFNNDRNKNNNINNQSNININTNSNINNYFNNNIYDSITVVLQTNCCNIFEDESIPLKFDEKFKITRKSKLNEIENELLELLQNVKPNLDLDRTLLSRIYEKQVLLEEERTILKNEEKIRKVYTFLNQIYSSLNEKFIKEYSFSLSFKIFKEFVEKTILNKIDENELDFDNTTLIINEFFNQSFSNSNQSNDNFNESNNSNEFSSSNDNKQVINNNSQSNNSQFNNNSLDNYTFDYTFITNYNDVLFKLKSLINFDIEISAGSLENNNKIANLLLEQSSKTVLIKNIHFLPSLLKTGSNRFFYIIEPNEFHPLMIDSRIIFYDRNNNYDFVYQNLSLIFNLNHKTEFFIKFHATAISLGFDFSLKDLEICIENCEDFKRDFLIEMVYFSKIREEEILRLREVFNL